MSDYHNDFDAVDMPDMSWHEQEIKLPLSAYDRLRDRIAELDAQSANVHRLWAEGNSRIHELENECARLRGDLDDALAECRRLNELVGDFAEGLEEVD